MTTLADKASRFEELKASGKLPSPTGVALAIMQMTQREDVSLDAVAKVVQADPALLGRVLKLANSPAVGARRPVATAFDSLALLGLACVRQLALGLSIVSNYFDGGCPGFDYRSYWSRSLATGCALQLLSRHNRVLTPEEAFSCGMLSRVGCLALATVFPKAYGTLLGGSPSPTELTKLEQEYFGTDHNEITAGLLREWKLPQLMIEGSYHHEHPDAEEVASGSRAHELARNLHFAAYWGLFCISTDATREGMLPEFFALGQKLGLDKETLTAMDVGVVHEWLEWARILNVPAQAVASVKELDSRVRTQATDTSGSNEIPAPGPAAAGAAHSFTILVADSDPATRLATEKLLSKTGTVHVAVNGTQALQILAKAQPDLILADWTLPGLNGPAFLKLLKASPESKDKYVIVLTAHDNEETLVAAFDAGADDYVTKPFGARSLEARVRAGQRIVALKQEVTREMREVQRYIQELATVNQRWEEAAFTDVLTGLPNRRYAMERLKQEWAGSVRNNRPLSCMIIDIDYFKHVNDTYGHAGGDRVLRSVAGILKKSIRTEDVICRVGGEEFLVICADTTEVAAASGAGERLNKAVANHVTTSDSGFNARVTISIGVAAKSATNSTVDLLLKAADRAVYDAKSAGRNRVCLAR